MTTRLSYDALAALPSAVAAPGYSRDALSAGIVHFGVGNFHRAHQAVYLDALFNTGRDLDWAIIGAGVTPYDAKTREALARQDFLTTVVEQSATESAARVTGPMIDFLPVGDVEATIAGLADPRIRIVALTVTEGGYFIDPAKGVFDPEHPAIRADAAAPGAPKTVFGLIAAGLKRRRDAGCAPFTVMSCDNLPHNGAVTREAVAGLARLSDPAFGDWIAAEVAFPNGMVDRITPATGDRERRLLSTEFGVEDAHPVFCEDFKQWVLEDRFPAGRPALETVGVEFTDDVTPYEIMKIRVLNGGHAAMAYPAGLLDIEFVHEAMENALVRDFLRRIEREEIMPVVTPPAGVDLNGYYETIEQRLANPKIGDTIRRLCLDGSNRQPKFILPTIRARLAGGGGVDGLALVSALWCRYCFGESESGAVIEPNDPNWERLTQVARAARETPAAWLAMEDIYGELGREEAFRDRFETALRALWRDGVAQVLTRYVQSGR